MMRQVFTVGHSTHPLAHFLGLLRVHRITAIADVRSAPYSRYNPQYNRETLRAQLKQAGVAYVFLGRELGARSDDPACYEQGRVVYDRLAATRTFQEGLKRIEEGSQSYRIAMLCAEKDPMYCHRGILVARHLIPRGFLVEHIREDRSIEPHDAALQRLVRILRITEDLFRNREDIIVEAYQRQGTLIAYEAPDESSVAESFHEGSRSRA